MSNSFGRSVKRVELNDEGRIIGLKGSCKARDLQEERILKFYDDDFCVELGIKRID